MSYMLTRASTAYDTRFNLYASGAAVFDPIMVSSFAASQMTNITSPFTESSTRPTYTEVISECERVASTYSDVTLDELGNSYSSRRMVGLRILDDGAKPVCLFDFGIHGGGEAFAIPAIFHIIELLLADEVTDPVLAAFKANCSLFVAPTFNPDGMVAFDESDQTDSEVGRRNGNPVVNSDSTVGVNLNRQDDWYWEENTSKDKGNAANSEPETINMVNWMSPYISRVVMACDYHEWESRSTASNTQYGFLWEQHFYEIKAWRTAMDALQYVQTLFNARDTTGHVKTNAHTPIFEEFRSNRNPYWAQHVRINGRDDCCSVLVEMPFFESTRLKSDLMLDVTKGFMAAAVNANVTETDGIMVTPAVEAYQVIANNTPLDETPSPYEARPSWHRKGGVTLTPTIVTPAEDSYWTILRDTDAAWTRGVGRGSSTLVNKAFLRYSGTGNFTVGEVITGTDTGAIAKIVADADLGSSGALTLRPISGTFDDGEQITDPVTGDATVNGEINYTNVTLPYNNLANGPFDPGRRLDNDTTGLASARILADSGSVLTLSHLEGQFSANDDVGDTGGATATLTGTPTDISHLGFFIIGGIITGGLTTATSHKSRINSGTVNAAEAIDDERKDGALVWDGTYIYMMGGNTGGGAAQDDIWRKDVTDEMVSPITLSWAPWSTLPDNLNHFTAHHYHDGTDEWIVVVGGVNGSSVYQDSIHKIKISDKSLSTLTSTLSSGRANHTSAILGDVLYVFGGFGGITLNTITEKINLSTDTNLANGAASPDARMDQTSAYDTRNGKVYLLGGRSNNGTNALQVNAYVYDLDADTFTELEYVRATKEEDEGSEQIDKPFFVNGHGYADPKIDGDKVFFVGGQLGEEGDTTDVGDLTSEYGGLIYQLNIETCELSLAGTNNSDWGWLGQNSPTEVAPTTATNAFVEYPGSPIDHPSAGTDFVPGNAFTVLAAVKNPNTRQQDIGEYPRLAVITNDLFPGGYERIIRSGYYVPPRDEWMTMTLPFVLQADTTPGIDNDEIKFWSYLRNYGGGQQFDAVVLQTLDLPYAVAAIPETGKAVDVYTETFTSSIDASEGGVRQVTMAVSPHYGSQMVVNQILVSYNCSGRLTKLNVRYTATEDLTTDVQVTPTLFRQLPTGFATLEWTLDGVSDTEVFFNLFPLNHNPINRTYRRHLWNMALKTDDGQITFMSDHYGLYYEKAFAVAGEAVITGHTESGTGATYSESQITYIPVEPVPGNRPSGVWQKSPGPLGNIWRQR